MKCPKCHYLSFEPEPRCRNCGYDLALADADLSMRDFESEDAETPAADLPLHQDVEEPEPVGAGPRSVLRDRVRSATDPSRGNVLDLPARPRAPRRPRPVSTEPRTSRTAAAAARMAALDAPVAAPEPGGLMDDLPALIHEHDYSQASLEAPREAYVVGLEPTPETSPFLPAPPAVAPPIGRDDRPREIAPEPPRAELPRPSSSRVPTSELPLFVKGMDAAQVTDETLMDRAAAPRAPLGVRRSVVETPAPVAESTPPPPGRTAGAFDRDLIDDLARIERDDARQAKAEARALVRAAEIRANGDAASPVLRLAAAIIDLALLSGIALAILALTLRLCGLSFAEAGILPVVPLGGFLLLVAAGYLLLFTMAGGQTIGKMVFGLRTVGEGGMPEYRQPLTLQQAASRALLTVPSVLALGLGFLPALFGDRRALHDRLAHTRVVRA